MNPKLNPCGYQWRPAYEHRDATVSGTPWAQCSEKEATDIFDDRRPGREYRKIYAASDVEAALAAKDAAIARLREALKASRDVHAGLAEYILQAKGPTDTGGMFADLQRARLAADAALAGGSDA